MENKKVVGCFLFVTILLTLIYIYNQHTFVEKYYKVKDQYHYNADRTYGFKITRISYYPDKNMIKNPKEWPFWKKFLRDFSFRLNCYLHGDDSSTQIVDSILEFINYPIWERHPGKGTLVISGVSHKTNLNMYHFYISLYGVPIKEFDARNSHTELEYGNSGYSTSARIFDYNNENHRKFCLALNNMPKEPEAIEISYNKEIGPIRIENIKFKKKVWNFINKNPLSIRY